MAEFIKMNKDSLEKFFLVLKLKENKSWTDIAKDLEISKTMLFHYKNGNYSILKEVFEKIKKKTNQNPPHNLIIKDRFIENKIIKPSLTEKFSELLGAISGDGHLGKNSYEITITCSSKLDKEYVYYLRPLFENLFNLKFKIFIQDSKIRLKAYSKNLVLFLHKEYGLPLGNKKGLLKVPLAIKRNKKFLRAYIRGLFDTDGSVYVRRKKDIVVEIISTNKNYLKEIKEILELLGFSCGISGKNLYMYRKDMISKFFKEIKPANPKHLKKYNKYIKLCASGPMAKSFI